MRILILQFRRLGDVLMTTPMVRAIRAAMPDAVIHVALEPSSLPAIRFNPNIDAAVIASDGRTPRERGRALGALAPLMERCAFYFGNDNGTRHAAIAAGIPTAAVFGPTDPDSWTPHGSMRDLYVGGRAPIATVSIEAVDAMMARVVGSLGSTPSRIH